MFTRKSLAERIKRAEFCLDRVNLKGANNLFPSEISGGMQKRVAIARAIALNPKYLFCDEPNSGLDPRTSILIDELVRDITREYNITTIINTHDMNSVMGIGENIVFLDKGHKEWVGNNEEIFTSDNKALNDFVFASYEAVWHEFPEDCGAAVVNIISQLRRKMGPGNPIRTVPHSGYKFEPPSAD